MKRIAVLLFLVFAMFAFAVGFSCRTKGQTLPRPMFAYSPTTNSIVAFAYYGDYHFYTTYGGANYHVYVDTKALTDHHLAVHDNGHVININVEPGFPVKTAMPAITLDDKVVANNNGTKWYPLHLIVAALLPQWQVSVVPIANADSAVIKTIEGGN